jgi:hypothetical protein
MKTYIYCIDVDLTAATPGQQIDLDRIFSNKSVLIKSITVNHLCLNTTTNHYINLTSALIKPFRFAIQNAQMNNYSNTQSFENEQGFGVGAIKVIALKLFADLEEQSFKFDNLSIRSGFRFNLLWDKDLGGNDMTVRTTVIFELEETNIY